MTFRSSNARAWVTSRRAFLAGGLGCVAFGFGVHRQVRAESLPRLAKLTSTMLIASDAGGTYDLYARAFGRHLEALVPGFRLEFKYVNQASGKLAAKMLQSGPTDGSLLFTSSPALLSAQVLDEEGVAFDLSQWSWIGKASEEARFLVSGPGANFTDLAQLRAKTTPSTLSARSTSSYVYHETLWLNALLGLRIKPVPGYKAIEKDMAVVSGEVMTTVLTYPNDRKVFDLPGVKPILRISNAEVPVRFAGVPLVSDLLRDKPASQPVVTFMNASANLQRWIACPPGTDPAVLAELRAAFDHVVATPEFIADAEKLDFKVAPMSGQAVTKVVGEILVRRDALRQQLAASLDCGKALAEGLDGSCAHS